MKLLNYNFQKLSNQNTLNEIVKMKNRVADIRVIKETAHLLKEYCPVNFTGKILFINYPVFLSFINFFFHKFIHFCVVNYN